MGYVGIWRTGYDVFDAVPYFLGKFVYCLQIIWLTFHLSFPPILWGIE